MVIDLRTFIDNKLSKIGRPAQGLPPCEIFVADEVLNRIQVFNEKGQYLRKWNTWPTQKGMFFYIPILRVFTSTQNNYIRKYTPYGGDEGGWVKYQISYLYVYQDESYETSKANNYVVVDDLNGNQKRSWGAGTSPDDICIYNDEVYVTFTGSHDVKVYSKPGTYLRGWGSYGSGDGQFSNPQGIRGYKNEIYVSDYSNQRIQVFDVNGNFKRKWNVGAVTSYIDVFADRVFVGTCTVGVIKVYDLFGGLKGIIGSKGAGDGQFDMIGSISIRPL